MKNTQIAISFSEKKILGLAKEVIYLTLKLPNKRLSHLCTTIFNDKEFTTSQERPFYFQSAVINIKSFLLLSKILFLCNFHTCCSSNFQRTYPSLLHMAAFIDLKISFSPWNFLLSKLNILLFKN